VKIGDWVRLKDVEDVPDKFWPDDLSKDAVGYIASIASVDSQGEDGVTRELWNVRFQLDEVRLVDLQFYERELVMADAISRLANVSADGKKSRDVKTRILDLKKGQILLVEFGMEHVPRDNAQKLVMAWRQEILNVAEKAGIPPENFPLLVIAGDIKFTTVDAVELLSLVGKTAG
jgi:hypothetical protein